MNEGKRRQTTAREGVDNCVVDCYGGDENVKTQKAMLVLTQLRVAATHLSPNGKAIVKTAIMENHAVKSPNSRQR